MYERYLHNIHSYDDSDTCWVQLGLGFEIERWKNKMAQTRCFQVLQHKTLNGVVEENSLTNFAN